jgi:hypothetical protein
MKQTALIRITILSVFTGLLTACPLKNRPRQVHEPAKTWTPTETPVDETVSAAAFSTLDPSKSDLRSLAKIVLNGKFVENPKFRTLRLGKIINAFHRAFLSALDRHDNSAEIQRLKADYYATVNAGCSEDMRTGCINKALFNRDPFFTRIMVRLAQEYDAAIDAELMKYGNADECLDKSATCRNLLYARYRRLAMATGKQSSYDDKEYAFSYLKYAREFAALIERDKQADKRLSYLAEVHTQIFETIIMRYEPENMSGSEFRAFVENFKPWTYSHKTAGVSELGAKRMFEFGAKCCMYENAGKNKLSPSLTKAIFDLQMKEKDDMGDSFYKKVKKIHERNNSIFLNLGLGAESSRLLNLNSSFYNEYFFLVDRLFRGHLRPTEIETILSQTPIQRTREILPKTIEIYLKVQLIDVMIQTNEFMNNIYTRKVDGNMLFSAAKAESNELAAKWHAVQTQAEQLERTMSGFFKERGISGKEIEDTSRMIKAINRNVHSISVFPNMIITTYFLSKAGGDIPHASVAALFDSDISDVWYHFGKDIENLTREILPYSFEFMLKTDSLTTFQSDRAKFYDVIFSKYLGDSIRDLRNETLKLHRDIYAHNDMKAIDAICDYELNDRRPPSLRMTLYDLSHYTYGGVGENGINKTMSKFLKEPGVIIENLRAKVDTRLMFVKVLIDIIEKDLERRHEIVKNHAETKAAYDALKTLQKFRAQVTSDFVKSHERIFECSLKLKDIERRRANRLYEEERNHLSMIFDQMRPLLKIKDPGELKAKVKEINTNFFRRKDSGYRFDEFDGTSYIMSKYDLLKRMKHRVESDVFRVPSKDERELYGKDDPYYRPRFVAVDEPNSLVGDDMIAMKTSTRIFVNGDSEADRQTFIDHGMSLLNGQAGSYIDWYGQAKGRIYDQYVSTLLEFYFQGPLLDEQSRKLELTARDVIRAFIRAQASYGMDKSDLKTAIQFGAEGFLDSNDYRGRLFEDSGTPLPFFHKLMLESIQRSGTELDDRNQKKTAAVEALKFAANEINLREEASNSDYRPGSFVFKPGQNIAASLKAIYGARANSAYQRTVDLFNEMEKAQNEMFALADPGQEVAKKWDLDVRELARLALPIYRADGQPVIWYTGNRTLVDERMLRGQLIMIDDFIRRTSNFYDTAAAVRRK